MDASIKLNCSFFRCSGFFFVFFFLVKNGWSVRAHSVCLPEILTKMPPDLVNEINFGKMPVKNENEQNVNVWKFRKCEFRNALWHSKNVEHWSIEWVTKTFRPFSILSLSETSFIFSKANKSISCTFRCRFIRCSLLRMHSFTMFFSSLLSFRILYSVCRIFGIGYV